jgi:hypothetical protein
MRMEGELEDMLQVWLEVILAREKGRKWTLECRIVGSNLESMTVETDHNQYIAGIFHNNRWLTV